jgi:hypothetical protein
VSEPLSCRSVVTRRRLCCYDNATRCPAVDVGGNGRVIRKPLPKEVRVRIDYGKNKKRFVTPTLVDYAIQPHPEPA